MKIENKRSGSSGNILVVLGLASLIGLCLVHAQDATTTQSSAPAVTDTNVDWNSLSDAQIELMAIEQVSPMPYSQLSESDKAGGTFWSAQHSPVSAEPWPPLPADLGQLSVWNLSTNNQDQGVFLLDDLAVNYNSPSTTTTQTAGTMQTLDSTNPPSPGGTNDYSTNYIPLDLSSTPIDTNGLWLQINGVSNGLVYVTLNNTTNGVEYQILSQEALSSAPMSSWDAEGSPFWGSATTNWTAVTVPQNARSNLFLSVQSQIDTTGTGIPSWWWLKYFGQDTNVDAYGDPAGDGWNNLEKFQLGMNPNLFYTPPAPQGLTANYNSYNNTATVSWQPSPGPVTGYTVEKDDSNLGTAQYFSIPIDETYFVDNVATNLYDSDLGETLSVSYQVQAIYGTNGSYWGGPVPLQQNTLSASFIAGPQGSAYVAVAAVPAGTVALRVTRFDELAFENDQFGDNTPYFTNFDIPLSASTNGLYLIPSSWVVMQPDAYGSSYAYDWSVETLNTNGTPNANGSIYRGYYFPTEDDRGWLVPPYFDGRAQLKQNLIFLLRAGVKDSPFDYTGINTNDGGNIYYFSNPNGYAYSGFYPLDENPNDQFYYENIGSFDVYWPFENNYRYRNFVFSAANLDGNGHIATGVGGNYAGMSGIFPQDPNRTFYGLYQIFPMTYQFEPPVTNGATIPALLATNQTQWLASYALNSSSSYLGQIGITYNAQTQIYSMAGAAQNAFGLPFLSAEIAYNTGNGLGTTKLSANGYTSQAGYFYPEAAQPQFQTQGYDFWNPNLDPLPGMTNFSTASTSRTMITSVGNPNFQVVGYAKLAVLNGYSGVYAYLGQYFTNAYQIDDNGNVTTNTTGVLSPYGQFFATQPGPVALETMPDLDTGARGTCTVYCISLALDANHDGTMDTTFGGPDGTSQANPYVFWANNNYDRWDYDTLSGVAEQDDVPPGDPNSSGQDYDPNAPDCNYHDLNGDRVIPDTRDLEDFARLWVCGITSGLVSNLPPGSTITLSWGDIGNPDWNGNNPTIDVFQSVEGDGGIGYLTNETIANEQLGSSLYVGRIGPGQGIQKPAYMFGSGYNLNHLIWCGVSNGVGELTMTIADGNGNTLAQASQWIQIVDIKQMYERWTVGDAPSKPPLDTPIPSADDLPTNVMQQPFLYSTNIIPGTPYILFVHGYNMTPYDKDRFADTAFKRLYWQGYQGRFGAFQWPCVNNAFEFDYSEQQAWESGFGLWNLLTKLNSEYPGNVYLFAHSQGNVVAGEALKDAGTNYLVNTYIAAQAAVPSHCYDSTTPIRSIPPSLDGGTPDRHAYYPTNGGACYFNGIGGARTFVNFYNTNDWALTFAWPKDQNAKPTLWPTLGYSFTAPDTYFGDFGQEQLYFPADTYEIYAQIIQARCNTLGAQPDVGGPFKTLTYHQLNLPSIWPPDLSGGNYGTHIWHSAEFRSDYPQRWLFWDEVLFQMGLRTEL